MTSTTENVVDWMKLKEKGCEEEGDEMVNYWSRTITCYAMTFDNDIDDLEMHGPQCQSLSELNLQYQGWLHSWLHPWGFLQWVPTAKLGENKQMWKNKVYDDFKHFVKLKWGQYWFKMSSEAPPPSYEEALNQDSRSFFSSVPNLSQFDLLPVLLLIPFSKKNQTFYHILQLVPPLEIDKTELLCRMKVWHSDNWKQ